MMNGAVMPTSPGPGSVLRVEGLRKVYGTTVAVDGIDLDVRRGEVVALLGPNGAGKSTTLDLALGLGFPDAGVVELMGRRPAEAIALVGSWARCSRAEGSLRT